VDTPTCFAILCLWNNTRKKQKTFKHYRNNLGSPFLTLFAFLHSEQSSTVFYSDEVSRVGTFFSDIHRNYVIYDSIPPSLIEAVVSAEDANFLGFKTELSQYLSMS